MEIEKRLQELREKRNKYSQEAEKCQEEIDKLELEKHDTQRFIGKIIDLSYTMMIRTVRCWCYVTSVERLIEGPRFLGTQVKVISDAHGDITSIELDSKYCFAMKWSELDSLKIESYPEKIMNYLYGSLGNIDLGEALNERKKTFK